MLMEGAQRMNQIRYPVVDTSEIIVEETRPKVYVAGGKDLKESLLTVRWALHNSGGSQICILHVHQPAEKIKMMGTKFQIDQLEANLVAAHHDMERQNMHKVLSKYKQICQKAGVCVEVHYIERKSIEEGIVEFISEHNVTKLIMGAAADKHYSRKMVDLRSRTAIYVRLHAAPSCQIQFICKGNIIFTRQGRLDDGPGILIPSLTLASSDRKSDSGESSMRSISVSEGQEILLHPNNPTQDDFSVTSENHGTRISTSSTTSSPNFDIELTGAYDELSLNSHSTNSQMLTASSEMVEDSGKTPYAKSKGSTVESDNGAAPESKDIIEHPSPSSLIESGMQDELYVQLLKAMAEADNFKIDAFNESARRRKAEKEAIEAKYKVKTLENLYAEELRRRREIEETLEKTKEEDENIKKEFNEITEELRMALEQKSFLESQISDVKNTVKELEQKIELLQNYKRERDELQVQYDDSLQLVAQLREKQPEKSSSSSVSHLYTKFDLAEVKDATSNFDPSLKIGEGGYGSTFRGFLRHTEVAIKMLHSNSMQVPSEFQQEVNALSKLRHPNLVTLIGACPDACIIIYEYLSGGSLEDRLICKNKTPPLSWQNRIRIAVELCSVLIFLHSCGIVHGDLKPDNLLLDKNLVTKLSDFGIFRVLSPIDNTSLYCRTGPKGTYLYMDPEFLSTGELTSKSDTYSFGIILLRLLTGKPALGLTREVKRALNDKTLKNILDSAAGDWPLMQAQQLAVLAMKCCDMDSDNRPDLASEVWKVLEPMEGFLWTLLI